MLALLTILSACSSGSLGERAARPVLPSLTRATVNGVPGVWMDERDAGTLALWIEVFGSYVWPLLVGAFLYLHRMGRRNERELSDLRVYVAKNYNNKEELKNLFNNLQQHFDTRIEDVKQLIIKKGQ